MCLLPCLPERLLSQVTESSPAPGYSLTVREVEDGVTRIHLVIARMEAEDLGIHTVTVRSELGSQTYKVITCKLW